MTEPLDLDGFTEAFAPSRSSKRMARYRHQRKHKHYMELKRRERRNKAVALGYRIRQDRDGGGVYLTDQLLPHTPSGIAAGYSEDATSQWADVYFLSRRLRREGVFYNATVTTLAARLAEEFENLATEAAEAKLTDEEKQANEVKMYFGPSKGGLSEMRFSRRPVLAAFGNRTQEGFVAQWMEDHLSQLPQLCKSRAGAEIAYDYAYGLGLHIVTKETGVDGRTLPRIIEDFLQGGEVSSEEAALDYAPHQPIVEAMIRVQIARLRQRDARERGIEDPAPIDYEALTAGAGASALLHAPAAMK